MRESNEKFEFEITYKYVGFFNDVPHERGVMYECESLEVALLRFFDDLNKTDHKLFQIVTIKKSEIIYIKDANA